MTGTMTVHDGLAPELAQGLFAAPATYEVVLGTRVSPARSIPTRCSVPAAPR
ncbi:MAG: hypothetical protein M3P83_03745 [Actinomycetota bacterium]|nr:hypothetical protein [Actinomycetota bacterium]